MSFKWGLTELDPLYPGHALFLNGRDARFANVANATGLNSPFISINDGVGVMGCQLGDLNGDGVTDWFIGNGGPSMGVVNQLYLSNTRLAPVGTMPLRRGLAPAADHVGRRVLAEWVHCRRCARAVQPGRSS